jgi:O-antigen/teichoic acid export membrane protein
MANKRFASNTGWLIAQQIYSGILSFVISAIAANYLGPGNFGLIGYSASYVAFFTGVTRLGLDSVIVSELVREPDDAGSILGSAMVMRIIVSVLSMAALAGLMTVIEPGNTVLMVITLLQSVSLVLSIYEVLFYWFHARLESKYPAIGAMAASTVVCVWRIALLALGASVEWFAASAMIQAFVTLVVVAFIFKRRAAVRFSCSLGMMKQMFTKGYHFMISGLAILVYLQTDKIMIGSMIGKAYVGYYTAAAAISQLWLFIPYSLNISSQPIILEKHGSDRASFIRSFQLLLLAVTSVGLMTGVFFQVFGREIIVLMYGNAYVDAAGTLSVLIWASIFSGIGSARNVWIIAEGLNKYVKYFSAMGAIGNIILNFFLIKSFGIIGAAIATLCTEALTTLAAPLFFKRTRSFVPLLLGSFSRIPELLQQRRKA